MTTEKDTRPVTLTLTIDDVLELSAAIDSAHQEFCTGNCECFELDDRLWSFLPDRCDHSFRQGDSLFVCTLPTGHPGGHHVGIMPSTRADHGATA
jgi:hypothetical protein